MVCSFLVSGLVHEAVAFVAMRRTSWPFNTLFLALSACMTPFWDALFPVIAPAAAADAVITHSQPAAARNGASSAAAAAPPPGAVSDSPTVGIGERRTEERPSEGSGVGAGGTESSPRGRRRAATRPRMGISRGRIAVVTYAAATLPLTLAVDYLVWQWWRHTHSAD